MPNPGKDQVRERHGREGGRLCRCSLWVRSSEKERSKGGKRAGRHSCKGRESHHNKGGGPLRDYLRVSRLRGRKERSKNRKAKVAARRGDKGGSPSLGGNAGSKE